MQRQHFHVGRLAITPCLIRRKRRDAREYSSRERRLRHARRVDLTWLLRSPQRNLAEEHGATCIAPGKRPTVNPTPPPNPAASFAPYPSSRAITRIYTRIGSTCRVHSAATQSIGYPWCCPAASRTGRVTLNGNHPSSMTKPRVTTKKPTSRPRRRRRRRHQRYEMGGRVG